MTAALYQVLTTVCGPLVGLYLNRRARRGKEDGARLGERFGRPGLPRPRGPLIWVHGASVGEALSVLPLVERLLAAEGAPRLLLTTGTVTSARLLETRMPDGAIHQYVPVDRLSAVRRFLDHWRPDLALWVESEFWPNLVLETQRRGTPMVLLNARMAERSYRRWRRFSGLIGRMLRGFSLCLAQSTDEAGRLEALGAQGVKCVGNLKYAASPLPVDDRDLEALRVAFGDRPRWLAASTHEGEEGTAGLAHHALAGRFPGLLTIIAPRHATRGAAVARALAVTGLGVARRSAGEQVTPDCDVYVADTMGELGLFYRLSEVAFIGGSLVPHGGQNPLEAARLGCALLFGPNMQNFAQPVAELKSREAVTTVADGTALAEAVAALLADPGLRRTRSEAAAEVARGGERVLDAVLAELQPFLPRAHLADARARA